MSYMCNNIVRVGEGEREVDKDGAQFVHGETMLWRSMTKAEFPSFMGERGTREIPKASNILVTELVALHKCYN